MKVGKLGATIAIVAVLGAVVAFALRGGNTSKVMSPPAQPHTEAAPQRPATVAPPVHVNVPGGTAVMSWEAKFDSADDYLRFVKEAMPAAQAGDGRAAVYVAAALSSCLTVIQDYHGSPDPEAQLQQQLTELGRVTPKRKKPLPQWILDQKEQETRRCLGLAREGAPGGYDSDYWQAKAFAAGDPLAQEEAAAAAAGAISVDPQMPADAKAAKLKVMQDNLRAVVESGDPDALFYAGMLMANLRFTDDTLRGIAVALASCELGADCVNPWGPNNCMMSGACPPGAHFAYFMQKSLGQEAYAQMYARAQQVVQAQRAGDTQAVLAYLTIDKHP